MPVSVLFVCTSNSARSILAEALLNRLGAGKAHACSAGSNPVGKVHPAAERLLQRRGYETAGYRSKSWDEFAGDDASSMDLIVTVCDSAAGEVCPIWPGHPATVHWGLPDPAATVGDEAEVDAAFERAYEILEARVRAFLRLDLAGGLQEVTADLKRIGTL